MPEMAPSDGSGQTRRCDSIATQHGPPGAYRGWRGAWQGGHGDYLQRLTPVDL